jgi:hypothetical protein
VPTPPAPPAPPVGGIERAMNWIGSWFGEEGSQHYTSWTENNRQLSLRTRGAIEVADDDLDVKSVARDGFFTLEERLGWDRTKIDIRPDANGRLQRTFTKSGTVTSYEPEGRAWLARLLPDYIRRSGLNADGRVRRILARQGPDGVLKEISIIPSDHVKRVYIDKLLDQQAVDAAVVSRLLVQIGREIDSDYECATSLIGIAKRGIITTDEQRLAYVTATKTLSSSYEHRRALTPMTANGPLSDGVAAVFLESASHIESDYEVASLLIDFAKTQTVTAGTTNAFLAAAITVDSDYELHRLLTPIVKNPAPMAPAVMAGVLRAAHGIDSDFELAGLLIDIATTQKIEDTASGPFFAAIDSIHSDFERGRVLKAMAARPPLADSVALGIIQATKQMNSAFEAGNVLKSVATTHPLTGNMRTAYIDAAERLSSEHERNNALVMLVRHESRAR